MRSSRLRVSPLIALYLFLSLLVVAAALPLFLQYRPVQRLVLEEILEHYNLENVRISFSKASVIFWNPLEVVAKDVQLWLPGKPHPIKVGEMSAKFFLKDLLKSRFVPESLTLSRVNIIAPSRKQAQMPLMLSAKNIATAFGGFFKLKSFSLLGGTIRFPSRSFALTNIAARVSQDKSKQLSTLYATATIKRGEQLAPLILRGTAQIDRQAIVSSIHAKISLPKFPLPLVGQTDYFVPNRGELRAKVEIDYNSKGITYRAHLRGANPVFLIQKAARRKLFQFPSLELSLSGLYRARSFQVSQFKLKGPNFSFKGSMNYNPHPESKGINLRVSSMWMNYGAFRQIFPDPLVNLWLSKTLFPIITKGMVKVQEFALKGSTEQIASLDQPSNRSCLSLKILWKELEALRNSGPFAFDHVSGSLIISGGSLNISHLKGNYGGSVVSAGSVLLPDLYGQIDEIPVRLKGQMDLSELPQLTESPYVAGHLPPFLEAVEDAQGIAPLKVQGKWLLAGDRFVMDSGSFGPANCHLTYDGIDIDLQDAIVQFRKGFGYRIQGEMALGESSFHIAGWSDDEFATVSVHANGKAQLGQLMDLIKAPSYLKISSPEPRGITLSIRKASNSLIIECNAEINEVTIKAAPWFGIKGEKGSSLFLRIKRALDNKDMEGEAIVFQREGFIGSNFHYDKKTDLIQANIKTQKGLAENTELLLWGKHYRIVAGFACDLDVSIPVNEPGKINVFGRLDGYGITFRSKQAPTIFKTCQIRVEFKGKDIYIDCMRTELSGTPVIVSGHIKGWTRLAGRIAIKVEQLDVALAFHRQRESTSPTIQDLLSMIPPNTNIKVDLNVTTTYYRSLYLGQLEARLTIKGGNLYVENLQISSEHTRIALVGYLKTNPAQDYYLGIYKKTHDFPVQDLFQAIANEKPLVEGSLDMEALLSSQGKQLKNFVNNLSGQTNFVIKKGKIHKSSLLIKLLDFFSVQKIFVKEPPDLSKEGFYFEEIKGCLEVNNGVVHSDEVVMKSPVFNAIVRGNVNLNSGKIKADLGAQPFVTIDSILSRVPVVGYILTGKERALLVYYFKIRGHITEPKLSYVPLKNIGRSVLLFFRRAFLTPVRIFKNIAKFAKELSKKGRPVPLSKFETPSH